MRIEGAYMGKKKKKEIEMVPYKDPKVYVKSKIPFHINYTMRLSFVLFSFIFITLVLGIFVNQTNNLYKESRFKFVENGYITYDVELKENNFYNDNLLGMDKAYVPELIDKFNIYFNYNINSYEYLELDYENIKKNPKILCSYSDSTTVLNAVNKQTGLVTFYGSSPRFFENEPIEYTLTNFEKRLCSTDLDYVKNSEWRVLTPGKAEGRLIGGYLINFACLLGLEWYEDLPDEDIILFIEDHEKFSNAAMISKWFTMLEHKGVFKRAKALIFGHYSLEEKPVIDDILTRIGKRYNIPVIRNEDFGHGANGAILPISVKARLDTDDMSFELLESGVE